MHCQLDGLKSSYFISDIPLARSVTHVNITLLLVKIRCSNPLIMFLNAEEQKTENQPYQTPCRSNSEEQHSIVEKQSVIAQKESQVVQNHSFENQNEHYLKWKKALKEFLALKEKMWSLGDKKRTTEEKAACKICEKKIFMDRIKSHSLKCLELEQLKENINANNASMLTLSESIFEKKLDLAVRSRTKV